MIDPLLDRIEERKEEMIEIRRSLHQHPEISFKEEKAASGSQ
jgi:metal-dependent amidase/aminoacylase/carboxypeptidase family protein